MKRNKEAHSTTPLDNALTVELNAYPCILSKNVML